MTTQALLFDLDDTLISAYRNPRAAWLGIAGEFADELHGLPAELVGSAVADSVAKFYQHDSNRRLWRLDPVETRRGVVLAAFEHLHEQGLALPDSLALAIADRYESYRFERMALHPGALQTLGDLRNAGLKLGLLTNGSARVQRSKIEKFALAPYFDHIQIEGEFGIGKPSARAYRAALESLEIAPQDSWMIGDDVSMDMVPALALGMHAAWYNPDAEQWPSGTPPQAMANIADLSAIRPLIGL